MRHWPFVFLLISGAAFPSSARQASAADAPLDEVLRVIGTSLFAGDSALTGKVAARLGFEDPGLVVRRKARIDATFADVVAAFRQQYALSQEAAEPLARAIILWVAHVDRFDDAPRDRIGEELAAAIRASRGAIVAVLAAVSLASYRESAADLQQLVSLMEPLAAELPEVSRAVAQAALVTNQLELSLLAVEHDPSSLKDLVLARPGVGVDALHLAYAQALATQTLSPEERALVVNSALDVLLSRALASEAVAFFQSLPEADREAMLSRPPVERDEHGRLLQQARGPHLTLSLAAAFFLTGDRAGAQAIVNRVDTTNGGAEFALLDAALHPERDPFESLATWGKEKGVWGRLSLWLGRAYPALQIETLRGMTRVPRGAPPDDGAQPRRRTTEATASLERKSAEWRAEWNAQLEALLGQQRVDHVSQGIARVVAAPDLRPCTVATEVSGPEWTAIKPEVPEGFSLERAARLDDQAVALLRRRKTHDYWAMRSGDGGTSWTAPAALGLWVEEPYLVMPEGGALRLTNDAIELPVAVLENDDGDILPQTGATSLQLSCALSVIERDSDGDGLTDIEEQFLLTDPFHADSDRDGLTDDVDPIPHVPFQGQPSLEGLAILEVLSNVDPGRSDRLRVGPPPGPAKLTGHQRTAFVQGSRDALHGLSPTDRLIVLSPAEVKRVTSRANDVRRFHRPLVVANRSGTQVLIEEGWRLAVHRYLLTKKRDRWHYTLLFRLQY